MEFYTILGITKLLINILDGNKVGVVKGILMAPIPGSVFYDIAESIYELYDFNGDYIGKKDISEIQQYELSKIKLQNIDFVQSKLQNTELIEFIKKDMIKRNLIKYKKPNLGNFKLKKFNN